MPSYGTSPLRGTTCRRVCRHHQKTHRPGETRFSLFYHEHWRCLSDEALAAPSIHITDALAMLWQACGTDLDDVSGRGEGGGRDTGQGPRNQQVVRLHLLTVARHPFLNTRQKEGKSREG